MCSNKRQNRKQKNRINYNKKKIYANYKIRNIEIFATGITFVKQEYARPPPE